MALSVSTPAAKQKRSKLADTSSKSLPTGPLGMAVVVVLNLFMALLSFRGISTPSLPAQGEQRRSFYFNNRRDIPGYRRSSIYRAVLRGTLFRLVSGVRVPSP